MHSRLYRLLPVLAVGLLTGVSVACAQPPTALAIKPIVSAQGISELPASQAQQTLDLLRDDKRRAELITALEVIAKAGQPTAGGGAVTGVVAASPASALPLEPDSLVAQLINQVSMGLEDAGSQLMISIHSVNDLPLLWRWIVNEVTDQDARDLMLEAAWKLLVVVAAGLAAEFGAQLLLRPLHGALSRGADRRSEPPPPDVPDDVSTDGPIDRPAANVDGSGDVDLAIDPPDGPVHALRDSSEIEGTAARARRLSGALSAFRRMPFLIGRLLLDVVPIALFALVGNLLLGTRLGTPASSRGAILLTVQCYAVARLVLAVLALFASDAQPRMRLLHISDWAAGFLTRWVRRITVIIASGWALAGAGLQFGMYRTAYDALLKLFALGMHICLVVAVLQAREPVARRIRARHGARGGWALVLNRVADIWHLVAIFYIVALWLVWAVELRNGYVRLVKFFIETAGVLVVARVVAVIALGGLDRARALPALAVRVPGLETRAAAYFPVLRTLAMTLVSAGTAMALVEVWGLDFVGWLEGNGLGRRIVSALMLIGFTILAAVLLWEGVNSSIELHLSRLTKAAQFARAGRLRTLLPMLRAALLMTIVSVVVLMTLDELGVNIAPLLAGAGVVGIAVGFGSQKLVQDLITGLFLLLENAMQVGDVVTLGGLSGTVEALSIRTIRLRAIDGSVHIIPFSAVTTVTNQTRDYSYAVLDISVGLNEEPDRIVPVLKEVADTMRQEPRWQGTVLEPLDVMGVEKFVDMAWVMRVRLKTQPSSRWAVSRELNRRIKVAFDEQAIESPFTSFRVLSTNPTPAEPVPEGTPA